MRVDNKTCYMCNAPAVSREHVPPRCFFPKSKDLRQGQNLREKLQTVPSCARHNSAKSKEDEYFLNVVASLDLINEIGRNHYRNQIRRQNERNSSIIARFAERAMDLNGGIAHQIEIDRVSSFVDHFGRALYFLHYSDKWLNDFNWLPEFAARPSGSTEEFIRLADIEKVNFLFRDVAYSGETPSVFKYQVIESGNTVMMRAYFYEGCKIYLEFSTSIQEENH